MVEERALFEWSPEVALQLSMRFCEWVVPEDVDEDKVSSVNTGSENRSGSILNEMQGIENTIALIN
jgi:hypothetical protein